MKRQYLASCLCLTTFFSTQAMSQPSTKEKDTSFNDAPSLSLIGRLGTGVSLLQRAYGATLFVQKKKYGEENVSTQERHRIHAYLPELSSSTSLKYMNDTTAQNSSHFVLGTTHGLWVHPHLSQQDEPIQKTELRIGYEQTKQVDPEVRRLILYEGTCIPGSLLLRRFAKHIHTNPELLKKYSASRLKNSSRALQTLSLTTVIAGPWLMGKTDIEQHMHDHFLQQAHYAALSSTTNLDNLVKTYKEAGNKQRIAAIQKVSRERKEHQELMQKRYYPILQSFTEPEKESLQECIKTQQKKQYNKLDVCKEEDAFLTPSIPCKTIVVHCTKVNKKIRPKKKS